MYFLTLVYLKLCFVFLDLFINSLDKVRFNIVKVKKKIGGPIVTDCIFVDLK